MPGKTLPSSAKPQGSGAAEEGDGVMLKPACELESQTLRSGLNQVPVAARVDTGASFCIFRTEIAEALGLNLTSGVRQRSRTANRPFGSLRPRG